MGNFLVNTHNRFDITFSHGEGVYLYDLNGKKYLDFTAGVAVNCLGHCHKDLVNAITFQANKLWHVSNLYEIKEANDLAEKLTQNSFADRVFFCNSGSEAVETAIKMARRFWHVNGFADKKEIITFSGAFHGRSITNISASFNKKYQDGFSPLLEGFINVPFNDLEAVKNAINANTAAILIEPVQGESGISVGRKEFIKGLENLARENNLLLILDEVQCGIGRLGHLFAHEYYDIKPDVVALAKGIGGGFPLGATIATEKVAFAISVGTHGTTFGGNPLGTKCGLVILENILKAGFLDNVRKIGMLLITKLSELQEEFPLIIDEARGVGLMIGIQLNSRFEVQDMVEKLNDAGLLTVPTSGNVIRFLPPLIISEKDVEIAISILRKVLADETIR